MQSIEIGKKQINYHQKINLTYKMKITKTIYTNKKTKKKYTRYKIRIPQELNTILENYEDLYFNKIEDLIHITTEENQDTIYSCKIQKITYHQRREYSFYLSKKVFNIENHTHLIWNIQLENNKLIDSLVELDD